MQYKPDGISLKTALTVFFAVVTVLAVGLVGLLSFYSGRQAVGDVAGQLRGEIAGHILEHVEEYLTYPQMINRINARAIGQGAGFADDQEALVARFAEQIELFPMVTSIYFGNALGGLANSGRDPLDDSRYVIVTDGFQPGTFRKIALDPDARQDRELAVMPDFDARTRPWHALARDEGGPVYSDIYILFTGQDMSLAASRPVYDQQGLFLGVVSVDLFLSHLSRYLQGLPIGKTGQAFIMERTGELVACSKSRVLLVDDNPSMSRRVHGVESEDFVVREAVRMLMARFDDLDALEGEHSLDFDVGGRRHLLQAASLTVAPNVDWLVMVSVPEADFMAGMAAQNRTTILLTLGVLALVLLTGTLLARGIDRPIKLLEGASRNLTSGSRSEEIPQQSWFVEVRNLTRSFNLMSRKLSGSIQALNDELDQRRQVEAALRESQAKLQAITGSAQDAIIMMGPEGEISYWNPMAESIFGYSAKEVMGQNLHALLAPETYHEAYRNAFPIFQQTGQGKAVGQTIELRALGKNGREIPVSLSLSTVLLSGKWHAVGIVRDITEQKEFNQTLILAKEQAEAANIAKSEFLANMSHELRTPFNGIMGMMQLLQTTPLNDEQQNFVAVAIKSSERFTRLLTNILELSSIEAGRMVICPAQFELEELLESITGLFTATAREKGIALEYGLDPDVPERLVGDSVRVKQVLFNLVGNALKFTKKGSVRLHLIALSAAKGGDARIMFSISDTGIGIPDDKFKDLFQPFIQVEGSCTRSYQGAGLGLVIARRLVALMNGNINVESVVGQGTTVHVILPFALPARDGLETAHAAPAPGKTKKHLNILLAEDDPLNQLFMQSILENLGHAVTLANNGQEALDFWKHNDFDVILMDIQMPVMTGDEATRRIRVAEVQGSRFSGSAEGVQGSRFSGSTVEGEGVQGSRFSGSTVDETEGGGIDVGAKNLSPDGFAQHATCPGAPTHSTVNREPLNLEPHDSEPLNLEPYDSPTVNREPLNLEPHDSEPLNLEPYELNLEPYMEPSKSRNRPRRIPIIAVTAHTQPGDRERFLDAGMDDYLAKPVRMEDLQKALERFQAGGRQG